MRRLPPFPGLTMSPRLEAWLAKHTQNGRIDHIIARAGGLPGPYVFVPVRLGRPGTLIVRMWFLGTDGDSQGEHPMPHTSTEQGWNWEALNAWCSIDPTRRLELAASLGFRRKPADVSWDQPVRYGYTKRPDSLARGWQMTEG